MPRGVLGTLAQQTDNTCHQVTTLSDTRPIGAHFLFLVDALAKGLAALAILTGVLFAVALLTLDHQLEPLQRLTFRAMADVDGTLSTSSARTHLETRRSSEQSILDTRRKEHVFWLLTEKFRSVDEDALAFEISSKHLREAELWLIDADGYIVSHSSTASTSLPPLT